MDPLNTFPGKGTSRELSRRDVLRGSLAIGASLAGGGFLAACGSSPEDSGRSSLPSTRTPGGAPSSNAGSGGSGPSSEQSDSSSGLPSYYPADYSSIIDASKGEKSLTIYSVMGPENWQPIVDAFHGHYPWIEVNTNNLQSGSGVFQRYYAEQSAGTAAADMFATIGPEDWAQYVEDKGGPLTYESPETDKIPDWSIPFPGVYTFSADPLLMAYNKRLLSEDERPTGIASLAKLAGQSPEKFRGKLTTYSTDLPVWVTDYQWLERAPEGWDDMQKILPLVRSESSGGTMVQKLSTGEYLAAFFISSTTVYPAMAKLGEVLAWSYVDDGTPVWPRGVAITKTAPHVNCAKLMLDFLLSEEGQIAIYKGGFTPYRPGLPSSDAPRTYDSMVAEVGEENIVLIGKKKIDESDHKDFIARWQKALGQ